MRFLINYCMDLKAAVIIYSRSTDLLTIENETGDQLLVHKISDNQYGVNGVKISAMDAVDAARQFLRA